MERDYYEILGVSKEASDEKIKRAYRKLAHQYHPDKKGGNEKKFKEINKAYQILLDKQKKSQYKQFKHSSNQALVKKESFSDFNFLGFSNVPKALMVIIVFGLLFIIAFFLNTDIASKNNEFTEIHTTEDVKKISVYLEIINGNETKKEYKLNNISEQTTVFDILKNNAEIEYNNNYDFGVFIESINGIKNGYDGKYWQYYINDVLGDVAADKKFLKYGDLIEWRFEEVPF